MTPVYALLLAIWLYYGTSTLLALPDTSVVLRGGRAGRGRALFAARSGATFRSLKLVPSGWSPASQVAVTDLPPWVLSTCGVSIQSALRLPESAPARRSRVVPYEDIQKVEVEGAVLWFTSPRGSSRVRWSSPAAARKAQSTLAALLAAPRGHRGVVLQQLRDEATAPGEAERRWASYRSASAPVAFASSALALYLFAVLPVVYGLGLAIPSDALMGAYAALILLTQALFWRAHRALYPQDRGARTGAVLAMLVSPADAMVATRTLGRPLMVGLDAITVAGALLRRDELGEFCATLVRGSLGSQPDAADASGAPGEAEATEPQALAAQRSDEELASDPRVLLFAAIRARGLDPEDLLESPPPHPGSRAYCPRCLAQFSARELTHCPSCAGLRLAPITPASGSRGQARGVRS